MASGDPIVIDWSSASSTSFAVRITGIVGDIPLENFTVDQANNRWSATPAGGSWPSLSTVNGSPGSPGSVQVVTAAAGSGQIRDVEGNVLSPGAVIFSRDITIAPPTISGTLVATYLSGLGTNGTPITATGSLGTAPLIVSVTSTED